MQKTLKFAKPLIPLVLEGKKVSTWRLWHDKDFSVGDVIDFLDTETHEQFAQAKLTKVIVKQFKGLTPQDKQGHEAFSSDEEMYKTYEEYYGKKVDANTAVKIIWFELVK